MAKIVEWKTAKPDDPIYQTGWYFVHLVHINPKQPPVENEGDKLDTSKVDVSDKSDE